MGCGSCETNNGLPKGCRNNGACGMDTGCGKLPVFDWLANMRLPDGQQAFNCVEVRFKNDRKQYYKNVNHLPISIGNVVAVEGSPGHDVGVVTLVGELVKVQMKKKSIAEDSEDVKKLYRIANEKDVETWQSFREKERQTMIDARKIAAYLGLAMKICDVEYQADGSKITFFYTAESRVDFRALIKEYAAKFSTRIEMRQIGYRQEAAKVGGIGSCGRELCCSTWLTDFRSVTTSAARYQQLSINPQKLAGQCGKLKCCLNFELDAYLDALNQFPSIETIFETEKGKAVCLKIDVFKQEMWFTYQKEGVNWYNFSVEQVKSFLKLNRENKKTDSLENLSKELVEVKTTFVDVIEENSLKRFEKKNRGRNRGRKLQHPNSNRTQYNKQKSSQKNKPRNRRKPRGPQSNSK